MALPDNGSSVPPVPVTADRPTLAYASPSNSRPRRVRALVSAALSAAAFVAGYFVAEAATYYLLFVRHVFRPSDSDGDDLIAMMLVGAAVQAVAGFLGWIAWSAAWAASGRPARKRRILTAFLAGTGVSVVRTGVWLAFAASHHDEPDPFQLGTMFGVPVVAVTALALWGVEWQERHRVREEISILPSHEEDAGRSNA